ncbi:MAG TPA: glycosyltransferase family 1 protein [Vicinamibacterales bacterium]|jgi:glycosyltransferase involved in cell wall biosynthesis
MRALIDYRAALRERSGAGEYTHQLIRALAALAHSTHDSWDISIFSSSWKDRLRDFPEGVTAIDCRVPVRVLNFAWHRLGWPPVEQLLGRSFDIVHSGHPLLMPSTAAAQVVTIHDLHFLTHPERTRAEIRRDYPALARAHAHRADAIIVPSHFTARQVERQLDVPGERIAVCSPGAPDWSPRHGPPSPDQGYILFLGTIEPRKNVDLLVEAYARLLQPRPALPRLVLAGRASHGSEKVLNRIAQPPLAGHVEHLGYVQPEKRQALYEGAVMLVLPSFEEGFGLPALEAMTVGIPVIVADAGALPEVVGDAGIIYESGDPEALMTAMARILDDEAFAAVCAARGPLRAREFNWLRTAHTVASAYEGALIAKREKR